MTGQMSKQLGSDRELAPLAAASVGAEPVPEQVVIVPWGQVASSNGPFTVDEESARLVIERFKAHGCDLPIDYEHQTLGGPYTSPSGQAPAAGWIKRLEARPGEGIVAHVQWTDPAAEQVAARQYRYLSPVAIVRKSDRKLVALHSVALTNKPAIAGMKPIVNRKDVDPVPAGPTLQSAGEQAGPAGVGIRQNAEQAGEQLRRQLALDAGCGDPELLVAATHRLAALEEESRQRRAEDRVAAAMGAGRLTAAQRGWALKLCLGDEALFDEYVSTAPVVVQPGRLEAPGVAEGPAGEAAIAARARAEYRAHPELAALTSEGAYVAEALRSSEL